MTGLHFGWEIPSISTWWSMADRLCWRPRVVRSGWVGNIPSAYQFRGIAYAQLRPAPGWSMRHSGYGMLTLNRLLRQRDIDLFVCAMSVPSRAIHRHLRFSRVPIGDWHKSAFWIYQLCRLPQIALKLNQSVGEGPSLPRLRRTNLPGPLLRGWKASEFDCRDRTCWEFDSRFDDFWDELQHQNEKRSAGRATRET